MVSIRLLDDEYRQLKELCETTGARSVSDLAREAMFRLLGPGADGGQAAVEDRLRQLDQKVARLDAQLEALESRLAGGYGAPERRAATWSR